MSSKQVNMPNGQQTKTATQHKNFNKMNNNTTEASRDNKEKRSNSRSGTPSNRGKSASPAISPKTITSYSINNNASPKQEKRKSDGIFGNGAFDPTVAAWEGMSDLPHGRRSRGGTVMPEPETEARMTELARGSGGAGAGRK